MELTISSPCPRKWTDLVGNDRVRYCGQCRQNVYNLTVMKPTEVEQLLHRTGGRLCVQIFVREDRTATLRDCPQGRQRFVRRRICKAAIALGVLVFVAVFRRMAAPDLGDWPRWIQTAARWIDPGSTRFRRRTMGAPAPLPVSPAPALPGGAATKG